MRRAFAARGDDAIGPEFTLRAPVTLQTGEWQARTIPLPEQLLGAGCVLDVSIRSNSGDREFATRHIEVPLIEGFFEPAPRAISASPSSKAASEFVRNYGWYLIRVLVQAQTQAAMSVAWPQEALCSNGTASVGLEAVTQISLPSETNQRLAAGQWATASIALRTRDGGPPPLDTCIAELTLSLADEQSNSSTNRLLVHLAREPFTWSSSVSWAGSP
jgi:hypothetical protein